ncbi:MAG: hypothetical protein WAO23_06735 [Dethiobacteria bacterium]
MIQKWPKTFEVRCRQSTINDNEEPFPLLAGHLPLGLLDHSLDHVPTNVTVLS